MLIRATGQRQRLGGGRQYATGMLDAGYQQVGRDFPVFLHPQRMKSMRWHVLNGNLVPVTPVYLLCRTGCHAGR